VNWLILIAGIVALMATVGHFAMGIKNFLNPMMKASFDQIPKKMMHICFHYISLFLILSTIALLLIGFGFSFEQDSTLLVYFIALNYSLFAITQIIFTSTSGIPSGLVKLGHWVFWVIIAILAWVGA